MKAPSAILRSLSLRRIQPRAASVAPLPATTRFSHELTAEFTTLSGGEHGMPHHQLLDAAIRTQKIALSSLADKVSYREDVDRVAMEEYLETNTDILDACNYFVERIEDMNKYVESLRIVAHSCTNATSSRALDQLESCHGMEKRLKAMGKRGSCLRRTMLRQKQKGHESEFSEIVCGSKVMALMSCCFLEHALSFDCSKGGGLFIFPMVKCKCHPMSSSWLRQMQDLAEKKKRRSVIELQQIVVAAARELKEQIKGKREKEMDESCIERVKTSCMELEGGLDFIEGKVKDLYRSLIDVRMALLGILSQA